MAASEFTKLEGDAKILSEFMSIRFSYPFGVWSNKESFYSAIAMLSVFGVIFLTALIGHVCVIAYTISSRKVYSPSRKGALLIIANMSLAHLLFVLCCLPSIAYKSVMALSYNPWILSDVGCRMLPFLEMFVLGVTVLSFCVLSVDRFRSAGQNTKTYEELGDSCLTGVCKMVVIWLGALLIASPEIFINRTQTHEHEISQKTFSEIVERDPSLLTLNGILPQYHMVAIPISKSSQFSEFLMKVGLNDDLKSSEGLANGTLFSVTYQYDECVSGVSLWKDVPEFLVTFVETYYSIRQWWIFGFYFCLPVFFSLLFVMIVAHRLTSIYESCTNGQQQYGEFPGGTLNSQRGGSLNRSNSLDSNRTASSEAQNLMSGENRPSGTPNTENIRNQYLSSNRSGSPCGSHPGVMTPMIVRANNSGVVPNNDLSLYPMIPKSPSVPYNGSVLSSPSVVSSPCDVNGAATTSQGKSSSLPPHGRGSRVRGRVNKIVLHNIARDRAINTLLVALIMAFSLTWLPRHIFEILFAKTELGDALQANYEILIKDLYTYFSVLAFAINPIVLYLAYTSYRIFLEKFCCSCKCCCC